MMLKKMLNHRLVTADPSSGRPSPTLTDREWQQTFLLLKSYIRPVPETNMRVYHTTPQLNQGQAPDDMDSTEMQWIRYRSYINSVLKTIRAGHIDYCYYGFQISDLLKYEHDHLHTRYHPAGYWEVWLEKDQEGQTYD